MQPCFSVAGYNCSEMDVEQIKYTTDPLERKIMSALNENKYSYHVSNTGKMHMSTMSPWYHVDCVYARSV